MRVLIAGGGTGGHLYPGIAVARELIARVPGTEVTFVGMAAGIESKVIPREGFALDVIRSAGLKGKSLAARARGLSLLPLGAGDAWRVLSTRRPSLVIGVGGDSPRPGVGRPPVPRLPTAPPGEEAGPGLTHPPPPPPAG